MRPSRTNECAPNSVAGDAPSLQDFVGLELASIDGRAVRSLDDVEKQFARCDRDPGTENKGSARLCFRDPLPAQEAKQSETAQSLHSFVS